MIKLVIFAKNIDGGTGTFINNLSLIGNKINIDLNILVLEQPIFRKVRLNNPVIFFGGNNIQKYSFSWTTVSELYKQAHWFKKRLNEISPDIILTIDCHCLIIAQLIKLIYFPSIKLVSTIHNNVLAVIKNR